MHSVLKWTAILTLSCMINTAQADDPEECKSIVIADGGWTDNAAQNGFSSLIMEALGYKPEIVNLSLGVLLEAMKMGKVDVFLANWTPNSDATLNPYVEAGAIRNVGTNLVGAQYALAVPAYTFDAGLKDFKDIEKFHEQLDGKIHALEAGNDSNDVLINMQENKVYGFEKFTLVESSEQSMLAEVGRAVARQKPIVFVGWSPHPMNVRYDMRYLGGGDKYFGENYGSASIWSGLRPAYADACPNALKFYQNLEFSSEMLSAVMERILEDNVDGKAAALQWLKKDNLILDKWLQGVTTFEGKDAQAAVSAYILE